MFLLVTRDYDRYDCVKVIPAARILLGILVFYLCGKTMMMVRQSVLYIIVKGTLHSIMATWFLWTDKGSLYYEAH